MKRIAKRSLIALAVILAVLMLLNPSKREFDDFIGYKHYSVRNRRIHNYLIFSTYDTNTEGGRLFTGVAANFYQR